MIHNVSQVVLVRYTLHPRPLVLNNLPRKRKCASKSGRFSGAHYTISLMAVTPKFSWPWV
jgi:hypothetical protein